MLFCRRLLPGVHLPKRLPTHTLTRQILLNTVTPSLHPSTIRSNDGPANTVQVIAQETSDNFCYSAGPSSGESVESMLERLLQISKDKVSSCTESSWKMQKRPQRAPKTGQKYDPFDAYMQLRDRDRSLVARLSMDTFTSLAQKAYELGSATIVDCLVADVVEGFMHDEHHQRQLALLLLDLADDRHMLLGRPRILSLLQVIESSGAISDISFKSVMHILRRVSERPADPCDEGILQILLPVLRQAVRVTRVPKGGKILTYHPPSEVYTAFLVVSKFLLLEREQEALDLFRLLVDTRQIPVEAFHEMKQIQSRNLHYIIVSSLVRSCIHWNWRTQAIAFLTKMVQDPRCRAESNLSNLCVDILYAVLDSPSSAALAQCRTLLCALDPHTTIPDGVIRLFYKCAHQLNETDVAEAFFAYTQSDEVLERVQYPPPQGPALTWLMNRLTSKSRNAHLGRLLAKQIVEGFEPIPVTDRSRFIALAAAHGYAAQARALWERYSTGKDQNAVLGNAATMLRMISLYANMISKAGRRIEKMKLAAKDATGDVEQMDDFSYEEKLDDFTEFADRVLHAFRQTTEPLSEASHSSISSLARAYFILGRITEGFDMFQILLDRKEIPDMHDINIALSAMAQHSPSDAAEVVEQMIKRGLKPDAVTFGTILHHAVIHGDMDLVVSLATRASDFGPESMSSMSLEMIIRGSLKLGDQSRSTLRKNLHEAWHIIRDLRDSKHLCSPNTGKYCISASLHAGDPVLAFKIWDFLVREKTDWNGRDQVSQRRRIAEMIRKHCTSGWLNRDHGVMMLAELKEKTGMGMAGNDT